LHFLYELHPKFAAFPTFPINLGFKQTDQDVFDFIARTTTGDVPGVPPFDAQRSVDGERGIEILRPLPVSSDGLDLEIRNRVIGVYDKGSLAFEHPFHPCVLTADTAPRWSDDT
jgi:peroxisomal enoyl-CoA hydratase 2